MQGNFLVLCWFECVRVRERVSLLSLHASLLVNVLLPGNDFVPREHLVVNINNNI